VAVDFVRAAKVYIIDLFVAVALRFWDCVMRLGIHQEKAKEVVTWCLQSFCCAVSSSGATSCWGRNSNGQVMPLEMLLDGAALCCGGEIYFMADLLFFLQLGDGSTTNRPTPVAVSGLSSGVAVIASGGVRLFVTAVQMLIV
jgi:hypothetical protein